MATIDYSGIIAPYRGHIEADANAGRADAQHLIVSHETLTMCPVDDELGQNFMASFGVWLHGWEARLEGSSDATF